MSAYEEKEEKSRDYDVADGKEDIVHAVSDPLSASGCAAWSLSSPALLPEQLQKYVFEDEDLVATFEDFVTRVTLPACVCVCVRACCVHCRHRLLMSCRGCEARMRA